MKLGALSKETFALDLFEGKSVPAGLEAVAATAWLYEDNLQVDATILEESISLPFYEAVLTLLVMREAIEAQDDYRDPGVNELDPDEFGLGRRRWPRR